MKKLTFLLFLAVIGVAAAEPVTPKRAATVAHNFMAEKIDSKAPFELTMHSADWYFAGLYLFENEDGGWVIVANEDCVKPILGYSTTGHIDPTNMSPALRQWLNGYEEQISAIWKARAAKQQIKVYPADIAEWYRLENGIADDSKDGNEVAPLITTRWDQDYPYNYLCPRNRVTGCAATAMAQFMKFWNYPAFGFSNHSYISPRTNTTESADFAHTIYDWDNMPDSTYQYNTLEEIFAVATLMYHCGVSIEMDYGTAAQGGSSARGIIGYEGIPSQDNALKDYFFYSRDMSVHMKDMGFTNDSWRTLLINELDLGHPVLYSGAATQGGHGFICDGYDSRQYMHFNFGWSGIGDGYFPVDSISPGVGGIGGNVTYTFNMQNIALIGAVPDYAIHISDTIFNFYAEGGNDSLLVGINELSNSVLEVSTSADWLNVEYDEFSRATWIHLNVEPMTELGDRSAFVTFTQGNESVRVKVVQININESDMCPLTVVMENTNTHHDGWNEEAYLTLQTESGFVFGRAQLIDVNLDSVVIPVIPGAVYSVWHSGGGSDRYVNYWVRNQYGETVVSAPNAYRNGGVHVIQSPCEHYNLDVNEVSGYENTVYPNPAHNSLNIDADDLQHVEIVDLSGRIVIASPQKSIDISQLPKGHYFVRIVTTSGNSVRRFVKN